MKKILIPLILLCLITCAACQGGASKKEDPAAGLSLSVKNAVNLAEDGKSTIVYTIANQGKADWKVSEMPAIACRNDKNEWVDLDLNMKFESASTKLTPNMELTVEKTVDVKLESGVTYRLSLTLENIASGEPATLTAEFTTSK